MSRANTRLFFGFCLATWAVTADFELVINHCKVPVLTDMGNPALYTRVVRQGKDPAARYAREVVVMMPENVA